MKTYARRGYFIAIYAAAAVVTWEATAGARKDGPAEATHVNSAHELMCDVAGRGPGEPAPRLEKLDQLPEASGIAISRRSPGLLWSIDDSGEPVVLALDRNGATKGRVRVGGASVDDWEDVSVGPCPGGSCLYVADIGDNSAHRSQVTIYRMPEPGAGAEEETARADTLVFDYPDGQHDAEAAFVSADAAIYVMTKERQTRLYRAPADARPGAAAQLAHVADLPLEQFLSDKDRKDTRITDAESTPDGRWVALRTNSELLLLRTRDLVAGNTHDVWHADLRPLDETQGEGVAMSNDGDVYLTGEGGGKGLPGTLAHIKCALPR